MYEIFNFFEAALWIGFAIVFFAVGIRKNNRIAYFAAAAFLLLGLSDIIDAHTGAWWKPLWLLFLKGFCIAALVSCYFWHKRSIRQK